MARIRTIKPEFFTSEDIVSMSPIARLLYIGLWCEADRDGRLVWKPGTLKLRYLPGEQDDFDAAAGELIERGLVVRFGGSFAHIPTFLSHQRPNPRESRSGIPAPDSVDNSTRTNPHLDGAYPQLHAANLDLHAQGGREGKEGKGKEGKEASTTTPANQWWKSDQGIKAKGDELGVPARAGESYPQYKARLFAHINKAEAA